MTQCTKFPQKNSRFFEHFWHRRLRKIPSTIVCLHKPSWISNGIKILLFLWPQQVIIKLKENIEGNLISERKLRSFLEKKRPTFCYFLFTCQTRFSWIRQQRSWRWRLSSLLATADVWVFGDLIRCKQTVSSRPLLHTQTIVIVITKSLFSTSQRSSRKKKSHRHVSLVKPSQNFLCLD